MGCGAGRRWAVARVNLLGHLYGRAHGARDAGAMAALRAMTRQARARGLAAGTALDLLNGDLGGRALRPLLWDVASLLRDQELAPWLGPQKPPES